MSAAPALGLPHPRTDAAREIVAALVAAGIRATADIRSLQPPGVLLHPMPDLVFNATLSGAPAATWHLWLASPAPGTLASVDALDELLEAVLGVLDLDDATSAVLPTGLSADPLPAVHCTYTTP